MHRWYLLLIAWLILLHDTDFCEAITVGQKLDEATGFERATRLYVNSQKMVSLISILK